MSRFLRPLILAGVGIIALGSARESEACWCSRVFTRSYWDPCVSCVPASCRTPVAVTACPMTSCSTSSVERCYYEPQTTYETRTLMSPQTSFVRRTYYDPVTCCNRTFLEPVTQWVERSYQVPVQGWTKRCTTEPVTTCTTSCPTGNGPANVAAQSRVYSYYSPDGYRYYPVYTTVPAASCPVHNANGSQKRESEYGKPSDAKKPSDPSSDQAKPPPVPVPMPEKKEGAWNPARPNSVKHNDRTNTTNQPLRTAPIQTSTSSRGPIRAWQ